jgi:hypothetical protein
MFLLRSQLAIYDPGMPEPPDVRPATAEEITTALSFALRYRGRKRAQDAQ